MSIMVVQYCNQGSIEYASGNEARIFIKLWAKFEWFFILYYAYYIHMQIVALKHFCAILYTLLYHSFMNMPLVYVEIM